MTNKNPNREAAHNERKPASDQPTAQRKPSEAPGLITRSAYSAEPSRRAAPERRTARQGRPSGRAPGTAIGGCHACAAVGRAPGRGKAPSGVPQNAEKPAGGASPPCGPLPAHAAHAAPGARTALIEKRPPRARRPALPQPRAAVLSAKAGLTAGFGMGPGDPRLCGRARGGRSPAAHDMEPARSPHPGRPWRPHGGHGSKIAHRARCFPSRMRRARAISAARLSASPRLHLRPIDQVVYLGPYRKVDSSRRRLPA